LKKPNKFWHIPIASLSNHLNGQKRLRKVSPQGVLTYDEDKTLVALVLGMQDLGFSLPYNI